MQVWGMPLGQVFSPTKVMHYKTPYFPESSFCNEFTAGLLGIIVDMPIPKEKDIDTGTSSDWCRDLTSKLNKYAKNDWKRQYEEKFSVELIRRTPKKDGNVSVSMRLGDFGGIEFIFKEKGL